MEREYAPSQDAYDSYLVAIAELRRRYVDAQEKDGEGLFPPIKADGS